MATISTTFTTTWTPPDPLTGVSATVVEELSQVVVNWDITTLSDTDFAYYSVERKDVEETEYTELSVITAKTTLEYEDAEAAHAIDYDYQVVPYKLVEGDVSIAPPTNTQARARLDTDRWWVIGNGNPKDTEHTFELPVASERHTRPIQQEVFEPIVKKRKKVARGNVLGYEGTLTLVWMNSERKTAAKRLKFLAEDAGPHTLKSPFGDVWHVEFDAPEYRYVGGGNMYVEIGWVEVA